MGKKVAHQQGRRWVSCNKTLPEHFGPRDLNQRSWRSWFRVDKPKDTLRNWSSIHGVATTLNQHCKRRPVSLKSSWGVQHPAAHAERQNCSVCPAEMPRESAVSWWRCCVTILQAGCMCVVTRTTLKITVGCEAQRTRPNIPFRGACKENLHAFFGSLVCVSVRASEAEAKSRKTAMTRHFSNMAFERRALMNATRVYRISRGKTGPTHFPSSISRCLTLSWRTPERSTTKMCDFLQRRARGRRWGFRAPVQVR